MTSVEIRQKFLDFFSAKGGSASGGKTRGHTIVPSSSLIPDDPSVLLTTAGMQQFKPYFMGTADPMKDFGSKNTTSVQKSFRTSDIDEVGDESHLTFFEMLGNFSFGGPDASGKAGASYFKKEAIQYAYEFITKEMALKISYVTVFSPEGGSASGGEGIGVPKDTESRDFWKSLDPNLEVREQGMGDVFWGPTGSSGPCGPTTEIYCKNATGQDIEVWNIVFNQYFYPGSREELNSGVSGKKLEPLKTPGVDTGMGLERLVMVAQNVSTIFDTDLFTKPFSPWHLPISGVDIRYNRIAMDHLRGSIFLISDNVRPSNKGAGYILRRLIRRTIVSLRKMGLSDKGIVAAKLDRVIVYYGSFYNELISGQDVIKKIFMDEREKFENTLEVGLKEFSKRYPALHAQTIKKGERYTINVPQMISGKDAFDLHQSYGFTIDILRDLAKEGGHKIDEKSFEDLFKKHQEISRAGQEKKFGGHGLILDTGEVKAGNQEEFKKALKLHTTTHLLQQALREVLGNEVRQMGSDVTAERTRFDFTFPRKCTPEEIMKVENLINEKIKEDLPVNFAEMPKAEAEKVGALYFFKEKYPEKVKVYYIGKDLESAWSKEFCGGPHVAHTGEIGRIKIAKEEAVSAGVRRIRVILA